MSFKEWMRALRVGGPGSALPRQIITALLAVAILIALSALNALAVHDAKFEMDGNTADGSSGVQSSQIDWENFFNASGQELALPAGGWVDSGFRADFAAPDRTSLTGGGSKDIYGFQSGAWKCKSKSFSTSDLKFDLVNTYAAAFRAPATIGNVNVGDRVLYASGERADNNGSANFGVWFLQDKTVNCEGDGGSGNDTEQFVGQHRDGDVLIVAQLVSGGSTADLTAYEWVGTDATGHLEQLGGGTALNAKCGVNVDDRLCAIANADTINPPWAPDKQLLSPQFAEMAINLTQLGVTGCFSSFLTDTRSSHEPNSVLHDFAVGSLDTCPPAGGTKFKDANANGVKDASESGLGGWKIHLLDAAGNDVKTAQTTAADGTYSFTSVDTSGGFKLCEENQTGWVQTYPTASTTGSVGCPTGYAARGWSVSAGSSSFHFGNAPLSQVQVNFLPLGELPNGDDATRATSISCVGPGSGGTSVGSSTNSNTLTTSSVTVAKSSIVCTITFVDP